MSFEQFSLDARLLASVQKLGYTTPTPIQEQAIPAVQQGADVLGLAQTGTGKTAAFLLPILQRLTKGPLRRVRALVLAPTRELAEQIHQSCVGLSSNTKIRSTAIYGGVGKGPQLAALHRGVEIIIACPGRLLDLMHEDGVDFSTLEVLVLDEADRMCDMGFLPDIRRIIKQLPAQRQTLFFSATMPADIRTLANTILNNPVTVQAGTIEPAQTVAHALYPVPDDLKKKLLFAMLEQLSAGRVLIFTRTKHRAQNLARDLSKHDYRAAALQGNMSQVQRQKAIDGFRGNKFDILIATDIAARGIDVAEITHVINFDMPDTTEAYTHRIGRTGRAAQTGDAFTFAVPDDDSMVWEIEKVLGAPLEKRSLPNFDYGQFEPEKQFDFSRRSARSQRPSKPAPTAPARGNRPNSAAGRPNARPGGNRPQRVKS